MARFGAKRPCESPAVEEWLLKQLSEMLALSSGGGARRQRSSHAADKGLLLGFGGADLGAEQVLQVAALFEEEDNLFEVT